MKKLIVLSVVLLSTSFSLFAMNSDEKGSFDYKATLMVGSAVKGEIFDIQNSIENIVGDSNFSISYRLENGSVSLIQKNEILKPKNWFAVVGDLNFTTSIIPYSVGNVTLVMKVKNKKGVEKEQLISFDVKENTIALPSISSIDFKPVVASGGDRAAWARLQLFTNFKLGVPSYESNLVKKITVIINYGAIEPYTKNSFTKEFDVDYPSMVAGFTTLLIGEDYKEASRGAITIEDPDFPYTTNFILKVAYNSGDVIYSIPMSKNFEIE